ncbi:hypothetical protein CAEBREN_18791 [Caenorhabditis brenneri]|uniref:Uncharacterized protein n=1 Tax=Caenorhabditis brenneri TaxID=135651 RepID=G0NKX6_CAEBE|nr:hypothetical protein CAEBREN_18791 [Caenorhabditis brenneri]
MTPKTHLCAETLKTLEKPDPEKEVKDWIAKLEIYPEDLNVKETTEPLKREREEFIYLDFWLYHPMFDTRSGPRPQFVVGPPQVEKKLN